MHHQERKAIHLLLVVGAHVDAKTESTDGRIDVDRHGFRSGPGHPRFAAGPPVSAAFLAKAAGVHKQDKRPFVTVQEDFPFQFDQLWRSSGLSMMPSKCRITASL